MNDNGVFDSLASSDDIVELGTSTPRVILHRLSAVRREKGVARRELAERLGISVEELRVKEQSSDIPISTLYHWAAHLDVPVTELVVEPEEGTSPTHLARSQAARMMRAAARLRDRTKRRGIQRLAQTFVDQLTEILPALEQLGQKNHRRPRRARQPSAIAMPRPLPEHVFTRRREREE